MSSLPKIVASLGVLSLLVVGLAKATPAFACSCIAIESTQAGLEMSDVVFSGTVEDVNERQLNNEVSFSVSESWKGNASEELTLTTARDSAACGIDFQVGQEYLVYATQEDDGLTASLCSRTALAADAAGDIAELERLDSDDSGPVISDNDEPTEIAPETILAAAVAFLLGVILTYVLMGRNQSPRKK